jgi:GTPase
VQVRDVRKMLAQLPDVPPQLETNAANVQEKAKSVRGNEWLDDYTIDADLAEQRTWLVHGAALERFAQMTNFDYFEASLRFQRTLQAVGLWDTLEKRGVVPGDTVVIGSAEFEWHSDRSDGQLYESWLHGLNESGKQGRGAARWPHMAG